MRVDGLALTPTLSPRRGSATTSPWTASSSAAIASLIERGDKHFHSLRFYRAPSPGAEGWGEGGRNTISPFA